jgi:Protein of unknown function (DUF3102)
MRTRFDLPSSRRRNRCPPISRRTWVIRPPDTATAETRIELEHARSSRSTLRLRSGRSLDRIGLFEGQFSKTFCPDFLQEERRKTARCGARGPYTLRQRDIATAPVASVPRVIRPPDTATADNRSSSASSNLAELADELAVLAAEINVAHAAFERASARAILSAHHAGCLLIDARSKLRHGQWLPWVKAHFDGTQRTAQRYIRLATATRERAPHGTPPNGGDRPTREHPEQPEHPKREAEAALKAADRFIKKLRGHIAETPVKLGAGIAAASPEVKRAWQQDLQYVIKNVQQMEKGLRASNDDVSRRRQKTTRTFLDGDEETRT